jgi:hypothetical protein
MNKNFKLAIFFEKNIDKKFLVVTKNKKEKNDGAFHSTET